MYWPIGPARVYHSSIPVYGSSNTEDSDSGSGVFVHNSGSLEGAEASAFDETKDFSIGEEEEEEGRKVGEREIFDSDEVVGKGKESESIVDIVNSEERHIIVALKVARNGGLFATITSSELTIWQTKPTAIVAHVRRSSNSLETYGRNVDLLIRPDSQIFVVQTTGSYLMTYSLASDPNGRVYRPTFVNTSYHHHARQRSVSGTPSKGRFGPEGLLLGAGEASGVGDMSIQFRMVIKVDAGISKALALDDELIVATIQSAAVQCIRWTPDPSGTQITTELLTKMPWMQKSVIVSDMVYDRPMNISTWITSDGQAYAIQKEKGFTSPQKFAGFCFHKVNTVVDSAVKVAINARFSLISVACVNGLIMVYTARDYNGNIPLSHTVRPPASSTVTGRMTVLLWSPDGYCLFAGYEKGWAIWSVYGKSGANTFGSDSEVTERSPLEGHLSGIREGAWIANGGHILLVKWIGDRRIWDLEFARSSVTGCFSSANIARAVLQTDEKLFIYRGYDHDDTTTISQDTSVLWMPVQMPTSYLAVNWPIKNTVISPDGRYVAIAGMRGLAHYSMSSGRWKTFVNELQEQAFTVRGGMCWYHHILIVAVENENNFELRLYSRELKLDNGLLVYVESLPAPVVLMSLTGDDSLLVYTHENVLYHFVIRSSEDISGVRLVQVGQITFHGIVRAPARVRAISWILPEEQLRDGDPSRDVAVATVIFLVDGKLVLLQPSTTEGGELKYDMRVLLSNVEYYALMRDQPSLPSTSTEGQISLLKPGSTIADSIWCFDGSDIKVWMDIKDILNRENPHDFPSPVLVNISADFYPISTLHTKGIILGIESELVQRRDINYSHFKFTTRTHLFITHLLRNMLTNHASQAAIELASGFQDLTYFPHALEVLLHDVLDDEADASPNPEDAVLPEVVQFLYNFPPYLDVVVRCTRKTEVASWKHLFSVIGSPQVLFEESLSRGLLKTAGGYLLILHTLEQLSSSSQDMVRLFARAVKSGDWDLCKELARFLVALDNSGKTLREALELVELKSPAMKEGRSFMFESTSMLPALTSAKHSIS